MTNFISTKNFLLPNMKSHELLIKSGSDHVKEMTKVQITILAGRGRSFFTWDSYVCMYMRLVLDLTTDLLIWQCSASASVPVPEMS